jgi:hypothetical protein
VGLAVLNSIWILISIFGVISIRDSDIKRIRRCLILLMFFGILRGVFYFLTRWMENMSDLNQNQCDNAYGSSYDSVVGALEFCVIGILILEAQKASSLLTDMEEFFSSKTKDNL